ncbi:hypothetical protein FRD00_10150 [Persicimonas caeni]|nr:hypothetical protein FRD00_10150 [Persicimonas caeni]
MVEKPNKVLRVGYDHPTSAGKKAIRQRIEEHEEALVDCVESELLQRSKKGVLSISIKANKDGSTARSMALKNELGDKVEACIQELIKPINYGKTEEAEMFGIFVHWLPNYQEAKSSANK